MLNPLLVLAGARARSVLRERGLRPRDFDVLVGASGGPKWLVLQGLDRVLATEVLSARRERPLHLVGSSAGAWRHLALVMPEPLAAIGRLSENYIGQRYPPNPSPRLVSEDPYGRRPSSSTTSTGRRTSSRR